MINRSLQSTLVELSTKYPIVTLTGPRQSGKSTLLKHIFPNYQYVSLEDPDMRLYAEQDPRGFLSTYPDATIIDEVQRVPALLSYLQTHTDAVGKEGMYVLAGSNNLLLMQQVNQSLAGRTAVLTLLPFSHQELQESGHLPKTVDEEIFMGQYPRLYDKNIDPTSFYPYYLQTYVERDVRLIQNIGDLSKFLLFLKLCAGRIGQLLNKSSLAVEVGVNANTISNWLSVLEASYICYLLQPDYHNYTKRLVKSPKLYFYDTGLACSLLGIKSAEQVATHFLRGGLFENLVINEFVKKACHAGQQPDLYFWRDSAGTEIDLVDHSGSQAMAYEIKSGKTYDSRFFDGLVKWSKYAGASTDQCRVIYAGDTSLHTSDGDLVGWRGR